MRSSKPWLYAAARAFDGAVGSVLRRETRPLPAHPRRILVSNIGHLGDALLTLGVPGELRRAFPDAEVDVLVSSGGARLFTGHTEVSRVFVFDALLLHGGATADIVAPNGASSGASGQRTAAGPAAAAGRRGLVARLRERQYDIALELRSYVPNSITLLARSGARFLYGFGSAGFSFCLDRVVPHIDGEHELERFGRAIRAVTGPGSRAFPAPDITHLASKANGANGRLSPYTVLHPGTRRKRKRWSAAHWRRLAVSLNDLGKDVVITGAANERDWLESTFRSIHADIVTGPLDVSGLASIYGGSSAFIGVDSFPAHLAAVAGASHIVVLWHDYADPAEWAPVGDGRVSVLPRAATHETVLRAITESD
jgi:ADP-heptose:LPS heptosyltransferase